MPDVAVQATATTGIIRGIVVDQAIRPLAGVTVRIAANNQTSSTTAGGSFGFQGLAPGLYFITASKPGFASVQQSTEVVAGVNDPPPMRIQIQALPGTQPYHDLAKFRGYMSNSEILVTPAGDVRNSGSTSLLGNNGTFSQLVAYAPEPTWQQSVMVWSPKQAATKNLRLDECIAAKASSSGCSSPVAFSNSTVGPSPLIASADAKMMAALAGNKTLFDYRIVWAAGSVTGAAVDLGYSFDQDFSLITVHTYNYVPPTAYRFDKDGEPVDPS
jgi:hypothetical protein